MDPFLEGAEWEDFHATFNTVIREYLSPRIEPRYLVRIERRVYVEHTTDDRPPVRRADVAVFVAEETAQAQAWAPVSAEVAALTPVECLLPMPEEQRETYLVIRLQDTREVVTVLETLSPGNKRSGSDGRREYLKKREEMLESQTHLVELDLLRGGQRMPTATPLAPADYCAIVSRSHRRPRADAYVWTIRDPLPAIPIPLNKGDPDVMLDLQAVFTTVYDRARYDLSLDYAASLDPPLGEAEREWLNQRRQIGSSGSNGNTPPS
jgi:hypothetical protein